MIAIWAQPPNSFTSVNFPQLEGWFTSQYVCIYTATFYFSEGVSSISSFQSYVPTHQYTHTYSSSNISHYSICTSVETRITGKDVLMCTQLTKSDFSIFCTQCVHIMYTHWYMEIHVHSTLAMWRKERQSRQTRQVAHRTTLYVNQIETPGMPGLVTGQWVMYTRVCECLHWT